MPINISTSKAIFRWNPACWLRVSGEDAATFLQGQFSNDLRALPVAGAVYGLWLTLKGKVLADSFVLQGRDAREFWLGSYFSPADVIRHRLESHVIADDVTVEDFTAEWEGVTLLGDSNEDFRASGVQDAAFFFQGRRDQSISWECVYRRAAAVPATVAIFAATARTENEESMARRRISAGLPAVPADVGPADLPNEAGLEVDAVSYTKGCYLGQEVMARLKSMGQVRRQLRRVCGRGDVIPSLPGPLFVGARQIGEVRSAVSDGAGGWLGLAMLTRMQVPADGAMSLAANATPTVQLSATP